MNEKIIKALLWYDKKVTLLSEEINVLQRQIKICKGYIHEDPDDFIVIRAKHKYERELDIALVKKDVMMKFIDVLIKIKEDL